jgi:hypothetical protein
MTDAKAMAHQFLEEPIMRAGRPHPNEDYETALINMDADFVLKFVERHTEDPRITPGYFRSYEYSSGTDNHAEIMAKFGPPKA